MILRIAQHSCAHAPHMPPHDRCAAPYRRRYKTGVTDGPPCPQNLPLSPQITAADVQSAIAAVQAMGEAALKAANGPPGLHINVRSPAVVLVCDRRPLLAA